MRSSGSRNWVLGEPTKINRKIRNLKVSLPFAKKEKCAYQQLCSTCRSRRLFLAVAWSGIHCFSGCSTGLCWAVLFFARSRAVLVHGWFGFWTREGLSAWPGTSDMLWMNKKIDTFTPSSKLKKKCQLSFCKVLKNKQYHVKVRFHLNGHTLGFHPQTWKLKQVTFTSESRFSEFTEPALHWARGSRKVAKQHGVTS